MEKKLPTNEIKRFARRVWDTKHKWATIGALVVGNTIAGGVAADALSRLNGAEHQLGVQGEVIEELIMQDVATTQSLCRNEGLAYAAMGYPITPDQLEEVCDKQAQGQLEYWRDVIEKAKK